MVQLAKSSTGQSSRRFCSYTGPNVIGSERDLGEFVGEGEFGGNSDQCLSNFERTKFILRQPLTFLLRAIRNLRPCHFKQIRWCRVNQRWQVGVGKSVTNHIGTFTRIQWTASGFAAPSTNSWQTAIVRTTEKHEKAGRKVLAHWKIHAELPSGTTTCKRIIV